MIKRVKRTEQYEVSLVIKDDNFINPPRDAQRSTVLNRAVKEFGEDLEALHQLASEFVSGDSTIVVESDRTQASLTDQQIMEDWQIPIMQAMAEAVCATGGDVLEVGFGRGVSSSMIQNCGVQSHTIIECNKSIIDKFEEWKRQQDNQNIFMVEGLWQDTIDSLGTYDGIFFHTYPLNDEEYMKYVHGKVTFAEHFFSTAAAHLNPDGAFTYFSNEIDSLSRGHQRALFKYFSNINISKVELDLPHDVVDTWWSNSMVVIKASK